MNRRAAMLGIAACFIAGPTEARRRYREFFRRRRSRPAETAAEPEIKTVKAIRVIPLTKPTPTFEEIWLDRIGTWPH